MINTREYDNLYAELLDTFATKKKVDPKKKYTLLYPVVGKKFNVTGLLVCGRATDGWHNGWTIPQLGKKKESIIDNSKTASKKNWTAEEIDSLCNDYRFFQLTRDLLINHYKASLKTYAQYFTWTNLMKIAPEDGGNPTNHEFDMQVGICKRIFKFEIDYLKPKNVVIMSGAITKNNNWAYDFLKELGITPQDKISRTPVVGAYDYNGTRIITTIRPEILPSGVSMDDMYSAIVEKLKK